MKRILLVEDDLMIASGLVYALEHEGYKPVYCKDIKAVCTAIQENPFDLAILDMQLPDGTGFDISEKLKHTGTAIIFLTVVDDENKIVRAFEDGADDYITKPFRLRELLAEYLEDISHQLKTPITSMMIMADLLDTASPDKKVEFADNIKISLTRMEWLVTTLLKMAKLDFGVVDFSMAVISTGELIKAALQPLEILLDVKNQRIELKNDIQLLCDKRWTAEALTNLIKNASEHSPENSTIYIDSGVNPIYTWVSVSDSGEGIPKEMYAKLFKRFEYSQSDNGYGIGLPLALSIVRGQNGDIEIDGGGKGKGATFMSSFISE